MRMKHKTVDKRLDQLRAEQAALASLFVVQEARKLLKRHKQLKEFVMCMGSWFFLGHDDLVIHSHPEYLEDSILANFISRWDDDLKITGEPMRFTKDGPVVRDWGTAQVGPTPQVF